MHGGELETSILLNVTPELVRAGYSESDLFGRPSLADAEKGRVVLDDIAARRPLS